MRIGSPSFCKTGFKIGKTTADGKPMAGSKMRALFDFLKDHPGIPIKHDVLLVASRNTTYRQLKSMIEDLENYWGLDIRSVPDGKHKCLCGEWFGDQYADYVAQEISNRDAL